MSKIVHEKDAGVRIRPISTLTDHEICELEDDFGFDMSDAIAVAVLRKGESVVRWNIKRGKPSV